MPNHIVSAYQWIVSLVAAIMLVATVVGLLTHAPWVGVTAGILILDCIFILLTCIPIAVLNDSYNERNNLTDDHH